MFLSEYVLGKGTPGEARADLKLAVDAARKRVVGSVRITQPTSPPLDLTIDTIHGHFIQVKHEVIVSVTTPHERHLVGEPHFEALFAMSRWGADGEGTFRFMIGSTWYDSGVVPAKPVEVPVGVNA